ncbi:prepilin-type N-terminal cleavage/methylation domain-containing protein [Vibrio genomosp. F6]|uniref:MSHA biogenesis protein MshC n=1 Tax=Vibrio genomosp. F6 str. FF-238 TaxID=1191298 RepID=A0A1E5D872_9VIBR|nr:prepilin-type N-terminal cleavage/methylation domain-containing protein [Vibrio genomosp. F6]OEE79893.1 MSHA biogenesis protein MshC [Vibrio genomosp. F6 str. FF-238]
MQRRRSGFTLVELIVVIILIGIVSSYAASRYVGVGSFSTYAAQEQAISIIRQLQVYRMQSNVSSANTSFQLTASDGCIGSTKGCDEITLDKASERGDVMYIDGVTVTSTTSPIDFDLLGNPLNAASAGVSINLTNGSETTSVCINSQGYVRRGTCL